MAFVTNLDEFKSIRTRRIAFYLNGNNVIYFGSFGVENNPNEIKKFVENKNNITNIYRTQTYDSKMCAYFCIGFISFMQKVKSC